MLSAEKNAYLTAVGPGTAMGALLRCYWIPLLYSHELPTADGPPKRIRLLGESLIAFRDTTGRVGLLDHRCPHRGASLFYGRNEDGGLRCVYHGWKYDIDGRCLEIPNEAAGSQLAGKVRATAYPCQEANGIIWTYMGGHRDGDPLPALPALGWAAAPIERKTVLTYTRHCNWVQAMEGDLDSSHLGFLHRRRDSVGKQNCGDPLRPIVIDDRRPTLEVEDTPVGMMCTALRGSDGQDRYWRVTQFQLPFYTSVPAYDGLKRLKIWVPMDDTHTKVWEANWTGDGDLDPEVRGGRAGRVPPSGMLPSTGDWYGDGNFTARGDNDYLIDRKRQADHNFTGLEDETPIQDAAMQESMGPIVDRSREQLCASDAAIIRMRRRLMCAAEALESIGEVPPGANQPALYQSHGEQALVGPDSDWKNAYAALIEEAYARD